MTITVTRDSSGKMRHQVRIRNHSFATDVKAAEGGEDSGPDPHDLYDAALAACKALTVLWYAQRKNIAVDAIEVQMERDDTQERAGTYKLAATLALTGGLSDAQRRELLSVADKCPIHKLMTQVTTEITTTLVQS
ncbi:MAG: OsmC family protein [Burkholderiaceae bacterium]